MDTSLNFIEEIKKGFTGLLLQPVELDPSLKHIEAEGGKISLEVFCNEKIAKAVFSSIEIDSLSVCEQSAILWPADNYDIPVFWCNLTQMPGMSFHIFDLIPIMDIVLWPQYADNYLSSLQELKQKSLEILGDSVAEKNFDLTSVVNRAFSPYRIVLKLTEGGVSLLAPVLKGYCDAYIHLYQNAEPVLQTTEREFAMQKREAVRRLMKENDPGYPLMAGLFGEEQTAKVFDIVF